MHLSALPRGSARGWVRDAPATYDAGPADTADAAEPDHGFFGAARRLANGHPLTTDAFLACALLLASTCWLVFSPFADLRNGLFQTVLIVPLAWRRSEPTAVFLVVALVGLVQWLVGPPLVADGALLVAGYTVAVHESRCRGLEAAVILEVGAILASTRWKPADTLARSVIFLSATVIAALCGGLTVRSGSDYLSWLAERSRRLETERDQRASIAAAEERTRIAREMHDIVAHSLSVLVTLADAASLVNRSDPDRAEDAMRHAAAVGRQALGDMRTVIGVLRTDSATADLVPQPGLGDLDALLGRVRATGLQVDLDVEGKAFALGPTAELSVYRIVQESLTNTMKHASATHAEVRIDYNRPLVAVTVTDDGTVKRGDGAAGSGHSDAKGGGHGIAGMRERAGLHRGTLEAGSTGCGWSVTATLRPDTSLAGQ